MGLIMGLLRFGIGWRGLSIAGICGCLLAAGVARPPAAAGQESAGEARFVDLSLLVAPELPCTWPAGWPFFQMNPYLRIGPTSAYNSEILTIDPNTATQLDAPPHSIPRSNTRLPNAGRYGDLFTEKIPAWQFGGEACVIDCRDLLDAAPPGRSSIVQKEHVMAWEREHRPLEEGDVVLFYSGYSDKYYLPFPAGRRFIADPLDGKAPAWPDPDPECMEYLASRKVMTLGTDSPSMGPIPFLAEPTHIAGLKHGMIWTEGAVGLGALPTTGAYYCMVGPKHARGACSEGRAFAVTGEPLASWLIERTRKKQVADLSVVLADDLPVWWPGTGAGNHRQRYFTINFAFNPALERFNQTHMLDSHAGTHLVPPSYALPPEGFDNSQLSVEVQQWLAEYEEQYGPRGTSDVTTEKVPVEQTCGWARVVDVRHLAGTTTKADWPASPEITVAEIKKFEAEHGKLNAGEIVIFQTGHVDRHFRPGLEGEACLVEPLGGKSEGWPAPGAEAVMYLAEQGIRCLATDGPSLGGVDPKRALMTYWALGSRGLAGVEFLTGLEQLPDKAYFLFAAVKIEGCHGGPGRAIAVY
jgi:kynurenine formamidase